MASGNFNIQSSGGGIINVKAPEAIAINGTVTFPSSGTLAVTDSQTFTGTPTAPTPTAGDSSTKLATTAFVKAKSELDSIGVGQTWQDVTASRVAGTTYTNSTGKPIEVSAQVFTTTNTVGSLTATVNGVLVGSQAIAASAGFYRGCVVFIVPNGGTYSVSNTYTTFSPWSELR